MAIPNWNELSEQDRSVLEGLASSFGIGIDGHEIVQGMVLPNETEAKSIALEMFTISRQIIMRSL